MRRQPFRRRRWTRAVAAAIAGAVVMTACGADEPSPTSAAIGSNHIERGPGDPALRVANPDLLHDPTDAGAELPPSYREFLPRDVINPVYEPSFVPGSTVDWRDDLLVIGVFLENEARAYPVGYLNRREMVIDNHRGIPTLVTW